MAGSVIGPIDGHDVDAVDGALAQAADSQHQPTLIVCRTTIGKGAPTRAGTGQGARRAARRRRSRGDAQGAQLGARRVRAAEGRRRSVGRARRRPLPRKRAGTSVSPPTARRIPELAGELLRRCGGELPTSFDALAQQALADAHAKAETVATRKASQLALEVFTKALPEMLGGSADLTGSNLTNTSSTPALRFDDDGAAQRAAATSTTACASSAWPR